jgi:hypothetical protein
MADINFDTVVPWDSTLADVGYADADNGTILKGLVINALKTTTGAPTATAGKFLPGAIVQNVVSGITYINTGSTASPVFEPIQTAATIGTYVAVFGGTFTTLGGDATESITVTGATGTDLVSVLVKTAGATPRTVNAATATTNAITVTMSGDPSTDHVLQYVVFRAA